MLFSSAVIIWFCYRSLHYTYISCHTPDIFSNLIFPATVTRDVPCWLSKAFLWKSQTLGWKHERQGETSFTKTWQMKTAKITLWSSIWLWPYFFLNQCQQSTCWNKRHSCNVKNKKKKTGVHDFNLFNPDCPSLTLCTGFFTSVSQDPKVHDVLCFAGHAFPWLSPIGQTKTGEPALWKTMSPEHLQDFNYPKLFLYISLLCTWSLLCIQSYSMSCLTTWISASPGIKLASPHSLKCNVSMKKYYTGQAVLFYDGNFCFQLCCHSENMQLVTHPVDTVKERVPVKRKFNLRE